MKKFRYDPFYEEVLKEAAESASQAAFTSARQDNTPQSKTQDSGYVRVMITDGRNSFPKYCVARELHLSGRKVNYVEVPFYLIDVEETPTIRKSVLNVFQRFSLLQGFKEI